MRYPTETRRFVTRDGAALNREPPRNLPRPRKLPHPSVYQSLMHVHPGLVRVVAWGDRFKETSGAGFAAQSNLFSRKVRDRQDRGARSN
jgi:hypothetical protein